MAYLEHQVSDPLSPHYRKQTLPHIWDKGPLSSDPGNLGFVGQSIISPYAKSNSPLANKITNMKPPQYDMHMPLNKNIPSGNYDQYLYKVTLHQSRNPVKSFEQQNRGDPYKDKLQSLGWKRPSEP